MHKPSHQQDLNLLKALLTLLEERSVKAAAERLFITPSALSKSLHRLRVQFNDPLFIRRAEGLVPTQRAEELQPLLKQIFLQIDNCYSSNAFDPSSFEGKIRIAATEQFSFALIPRLLLRLRSVAPRLILESKHLDDDYQRLLAVGSLDFAVSAEKLYPKELQATKIYSATPMYWMRKDHPLTQKKHIELEELLAYPQIGVRTQNMSQEDLRAIGAVIDSEGLTIDLLLDTSHLLTALDVLLKTDAVMLAPDYISLLPSFDDKLTAHTVKHIPVYDRLRINLSLIQHNRVFNSPLHQWITSEIVNIFTSEIHTKS